MKRQTVFAVMVVGGVAAFLLVVAGCGAATPTPPPVDQQDTPVSSPPPDKLKPADFEQPRETKWEDMLLYESRGVYVNDLGQAFYVTVTGRSAEAVVTYIQQTRFYFEAQPAEKLLDIGQDLEIRPGRSLQAWLFEDPGTENLLIEFDVSEEQGQQWKNGYSLAFEIDPTVNPGYTHHYRAVRTSPSLTTKVRVSWGNVTARLYRNCGLASTTPINAGITAPLASSASGYAWYDLNVTGGTGAGHTYSFVQGLWSNWSYYTTDVYAFGDVTCW